MNILTHPVTQRQIDTILKAPPHAIAVVGANGAGKGHIAKQLLSSLLDTNSSEGHPYVYILNAQDEGIEKVRELQKFLHLSVPGSSKIKRGVIIEHTEMLGHEAQNALLKTLEEPPEDTVIICTVADRQKLLPTVASRLQLITVRPLLMETALEALAVKHEAKEVTRAYHLSEGNAALMLALLEAAEDHPLKQSVTLAKKILASTKYDRLRMIDELVKAKNTDALIDALRRVLQAAIKMSAKRNPADPKTSTELKRLYHQLTLTLETSELLQRKVQPKLALTRLFFSL